MESRSIFRTHPETEGRLEARGKFFFVGDQKVLLKEVTYDPFAPGPDGTQFTDPRVVERHLDLMVEFGANCLRTFIESLGLSALHPRVECDSGFAPGLRRLAWGWAWARWLHHAPRVYQQPAETG